MKKNDPITLLALMKPFPNADSANTALNAFYEELYELRKKHRIMNCVCVVEVMSTYGDGEVGNAMSHLVMGEQSRAPMLAAYALGTLEAERREITNKLISGKTKA